jgi:hypothetical protein
LNFVVVKGMELAYMSPSTQQGSGASANDIISVLITRDKHFDTDRPCGDLSIFVGMGQWTAAAADCLDIKHIGYIATVEADDLELEGAFSDSDSDTDSADGAE